MNRKRKGKIKKVRREMFIDEEKKGRLAKDELGVIEKPNTRLQSL